MWEFLEKWVRTPWCYLYLFLGTVAALFIGRAVGIGILLPILMTGVIYPVYAVDIAQGRRELALFHTLFWALASSVLTIAWVYYDARTMAPIIFKSIAYRDEMFRWIITGEGAEGNIRLFLPEHAKHFFGFCVASFLTGGVWGLSFGAILLNYMNFFMY